MNSAELRIASPVNSVKNSARSISPFQNGSKKWRAFLIFDIGSSGVSRIHRDGWIISIVLADSFPNVIIITGSDATAGTSNLNLKCPREIKKGENQ
jgi:hypothetical protein